MSSSTVDRILSKMQEIEEEIMSIDNREDLAEAMQITDKVSKCIKMRGNLKLRGMQD